MFFLSILISLAMFNAIPPTGWLQDVVPFETVEQCNAAIPSKLVEMEYYIHSTFRGMGEILEYKCMTEPDWIQHNVDLGHKIPEGFKPKTNL
jgi:hypothetical protein|tara:strand:- start:133 stop:408 length:276 start_codon:yes stop_codon:yes gene_type:complete